VKANLGTVRNFEPVSKERMQEMRTSLDPFYRGERGASMQPHYRDGARRGA
jgi:hypothetical protein